MIRNYLTRAGWPRFGAASRTRRAFVVLAAGLASAAAISCFVRVMVFAESRAGERAAYLDSALLCIAALAFLTLRGAAVENGKRAGLASPVDTPLPGRDDFHERLSQIVADAGHAAAACVEIDGLNKAVSGLGDDGRAMLARAVTRRIARSAREKDFLARLDAEKFAFIIPGASTPESLRLIGDRIVNALNAPYRIDGREISVATSVGVAPFDARSGDAGVIMRRAETALDRARTGGARVHVDDANSANKPREKSALERDLGDAIENNGLNLVYQPIVDRNGEAMLGVEALCRWPHPVHGDISPARFIPLAEDTGLIIPLGEWALRQACRDALDWPGLRIAVNVSAHQFRRDGFVDLVRRVLAETGLDSTRLELELTESVLMSDLEDAKARMQALQGLGVRFALDDFGTGYSSLSYLLSLPFDKLKIDRSFVLKIEAGSSGAAIVHSIISLGRALGMHVTAEGIETDEQHQFLRVAGVHSFQGYHFGRPVEASAIAARLAASRASAALSG